MEMPGKKKCDQCCVDAVYLSLSLPLALTYFKHICTVAWHYPLLGKKAFCVWSKASPSNSLVVIYICYASFLHLGRIYLSYLYFAPFCLPVLIKTHINTVALYKPLYPLAGWQVSPETQKASEDKREKHHADQHSPHRVLY